MREDADEQPALALEEVAGGDARRLDLPGGDPAGFEGHQPVLAERDGIAAGGVSLHLAALAFAELHPLGHQRHKSPSNPKFEARNPKQIAKFKITNRFLLPSFEFVSCFEIRISDFALAASAADRAAGADFGVLDFLTVKTAVDPALHADRAVGRVGDGVAVVHV